MNQKSFALIICYMGKLPWYFSYFVHSCKFNPSIVFIVITDDKAYTDKVPSNIRFVYKTLSEVNELASDKLGFATRIVNGYKLCDFKPAYGLIFSEYIKGFDYWGHVDIDIILGNIREFITDDLLTKYELISVRHDYLTGHFLLFKNNEKMNHLFTLSKDYKTVLTSEKHYCFDETNFMFQPFTDGFSYKEIPSEIESMTHLVKRLEGEKYLKVHFDFLIIEGTPGKLRWNRGKMIYRNKYEVLLYHLIKLKGIYSPKKRPANIPDSFSISPTRIINH
ncbi:MAG: hypothetical protein IT213_11250 [Cytophagales bacterium]|nr:hypothetical protein [Cytophagales bacterium]